MSISNERKKFALRALRRKPAKPHPSLSNTVLLEEAPKPCTCYVGFSEDLVKFVGTKLPRGVAAFDPAYLHVIHYENRKIWEVRAVYVRDDVAVLLWETPVRPAWITNKAYQDANTDTQTAAR